MKQHQKVPRQILECLSVLLLLVSCASPNHDNTNTQGSFKNNPIKITELASDEILAEGMLSVSIKDMANNDEGEIEYFLQERFKLVRLHFKPEQITENMVSGAQIGVRGTMQGDDSIAVISIEYVNPPSPVGIQSIGPLSTAVALVSFNGKPSQFTPQATPVKLDVMAQMYGEGTNGNLTWNFDLDNTGGYDIFPVTLDLPPQSNCDYATWTNKAAQAVENQYPVNLDNYYTFVVVPPGNAGCGGVGGVARVGNPVSDPPGVNYAIMLELFDNSPTVQSRIAILAHEIGHNLGLHHSGGSGLEYGDHSCVMGNYGGANISLNPIKALSLQAFNNNSSAVKTLTASSTENLLALRKMPSANQPQILKIRKTDGSYYYAAFRDSTGFDSNLKSTYRNKVIIYRITNSTNKSTIVDVLSQGETYTDNANQISVAVQLVDTVQGIAQVAVQIAGSTPPPAAPTPTPTPSGGGGEGNGNILPVASDYSMALASGDTLDIQLTYTDPDGGPGPHVISIVEMPKRGGVNLNNGVASYTPIAGYNGIDTFKWKVNDGLGDSNVATVTLTIGSGAGGTGQNLNNVIPRTGCQSESNSGLGFILFILTTLMLLQTQDKRKSFLL
ncbi:MAG: hypothetical protein KDD48_04675 [Bdellovibrionales bacterium]|nr:hypothetical protein [Bdellovibrionales bacterium]